VPCYGVLEREREGEKEERRLRGKTTGRGKRTLLLSYYLAARAHSLSLSLSFFLSPLVHSPPLLLLRTLRRT